MCPDPSQLSPLKPTLGPECSRPSPLEHAVRLALLQPLLAVPFALFFGTLFGANIRSYVLCYKMSLIFALCICPGIWAVRNFVLPRLVREARDRQAMGIQIALWFVGVSIVGAYIAAAIIQFTLLPGFLGSWRAVAISGMYTLIFSALFTGINFAIAFYRLSTERARAVEQMRAELAEAELRALRAQINPHFLFNTLNSIAALIGENPAAADDLTTRLAEVFRYALRASEREHSRLADELAFLRSYLEIERTRFGDRLEVEESIEPGLNSALVPSLLLQPVVENAVRHGISPRPEGGTLRLTARREAGELAIEIWDDGPGMNGGEPASGTGFGLHSVRERLRAAGLPDALDIESAPGRGTRVRIRLPLTTESNLPTSSKGTPS